jgi:outer membrane protein assembly factor BamA
MRQAVPVLHKGTTYGAVALDGRWYRPLRLSKKYRAFPLIAAFGARGEILQAIGRRPIPYPERTFMGGANSIRGFRQDQVGPYDTLCSYDPSSDLGLSEPVSLFHLPHGGTLGLQTSAELRYRWINGITLASFVDVGSLTEASIEDLKEGPINMRAFRDSIRVSGGVGARYASPVGPIRLDISFRRLYPEDFGPNLFVNCRTEEDQQGRVSDFFSAFTRYRDTLDRPPFAMVFFIAIGESI